MNKRRLPITMGLVLVVSVACTSPAGNRSSENERALPEPRPKLVASFYPLEWVGQRLGADTVNLTPPGVEPHDLELSPSDLGAISRADLVVYVGGGFQPAVERAVVGHRALDVLAGMELIPETGADDHGHSHALPAGGTEESDPSGDPHVWLDPLRMAAVVRAVGDRLAQQFPARPADVSAAITETIIQLELLDDEFESRLADCESRTIVTTHAAFAYLAARYRLEQVALLGVSPTEEPTAGRLREVERAAKRAGATTIFFESPASTRLAETLAGELGLEAALLNPIERLTPEESEKGEDYLSLMRANLDTLTRALRCRPPS